MTSKTSKQLKAETSESLSAKRMQEIISSFKMIPAKEIRPYDKNARLHSDTQLMEIANSMMKFSFVNPILIQSDGTIIAGHGRFQAATEILGMTDVPVIRLDHLSPLEARELVIADNKIGDNSTWDYPTLALEMKDIELDGGDLSLTGFDDLEIENLYEEYDLLDPDEEINDSPPAPVQVIVPDFPVSALGDVWILGKHRLLCGDSTIKESYDLLMGKEKAKLLHTDPPYNVDYSNAERPKASEKDLGKIKNDVMSGKDFKKFLSDFYKCAYDFMDKDSSAYIWHSDKERPAFMEQAVKAGLKYSQVIIWVKPMLLSRVDYHWSHEPCLFMKKGNPYFTESRKKTTVWNFGGYDKSNNIHPTQKPIFIPNEAIKNSSERGDVVLDPFGGSGSTLIACEESGRHCRMIELDPRFADAIIDRWQKETGKKAILESTNKTYANMKKERKIDVPEK